MEMCKIVEKKELCKFVDNSKDRSMCEIVEKKEKRELCKYADKSK